MKKKKFFFFLHHKLLLEMVYVQVCVENKYHFHVCLALSVGDCRLYSSRPAVSTSEGTVWQTSVGLAGYPAASDTLRFGSSAMVALQGQKSNTHPSVQGQTAKTSV